MTQIKLSNRFIGMIHSDGITCSLVLFGLDPLSTHEKRQVSKLFNTHRYILRSNNPVINSYLSILLVDEATHFTWFQTDYIQFLLEHRKDGTS